MQPLGALARLGGMTTTLIVAAVVASLATEVFPQAFKEDRHWAGIATALGVILAFVLGDLGAA